MVLVKKRSIIFFNIFYYSRVFMSFFCDLDVHRCMELNGFFRTLCENPMEREDEAGLQPPEGFPEDQNAMPGG